MVTRSSVLAWRIPMDRGAWRATVLGIRKEKDMSELRIHTHSGEVSDHTAVFSPLTADVGSLPGMLTAHVCRRPLVVCFSDVPWGWVSVVLWPPYSCCWTCRVPSSKEALGRPGERSQEGVYFVPGDLITLAVNGLGVYTCLHWADLY